MLNTMLERILGKSPYKSPTDMGVNMAGYCVFDDEAVCEASKQEIIRRYYNTLCAHRQGMSDENEVYKIELIMNQLGISTKDRPVAESANSIAESSGMPAVAIQLNDGSIITGKTSPLLGASAALLLNALKHLAGIDHEKDLIAREIIEPIQVLKTEHMGNHNPRLHTDEILIALSICAVSDPEAAKALAQLSGLRGCDAHASVILSRVDENVFQKLGVNITYEPKYQTKKLYHA